MRIPAQGARPQAFLALLKQRLVILDGAMGTMIQGHALSEAQFRGERFAAWACDLRGNNDLLSITQPHIIAAIHREYLRAGADMITTNTFNSSAVSQADYGMQVKLSAPRAPGRGRGERRDRPATLCRRCTGAHQPYCLIVARCQRSGVSQYQFR